MLSEWQFLIDCWKYKLEQAKWSAMYAKTIEEKEFHRGQFEALLDVLASNKILRNANKG